MQRRNPWVLSPARTLGLGWRNRSPHASREPPRGACRLGDSRHQEAAVVVGGWGTRRGMASSCTPTQATPGTDRGAPGGGWSAACSPSDPGPAPGQRPVPPSLSPVPAGRTSPTAPSWRAHSRSSERNHRPPENALCSWKPGSVPGHLLLPGWKLSQAAPQSHQGTLEPVCVLFVGPWLGLGRTSFAVGRPS
ncbi:uncharacterized protein LOC119507130 isoform X2 [Choloepus didactylus]|uniref:uncharacterized protein LOC119507130 isoform X2 n=1 Tax=Choloepus didactylus TaxID=27675 RepID=UPI00189CD9EB|nr:uncharacterized protein LOC119507130 isoform X2 [Choloepus didactylus]